MSVTIMYGLSYRVHKMHIENASYFRLDSGALHVYDNAEMDTLLAVFRDVGWLAAVHSAASVINGDEDKNGGKEDDNIGDV